MRSSKLYNTIEEVGPLSKLAAEKEITTLAKCMQVLRKMPYGRNADRSDLGLVLTENKGTCSSKHALVKAIAIEQDISTVQLILCIYKMNVNNTPGIGNHIDNAGLPYIPEAHCYLRIEDVRVDLTNANSSVDNIANDILHEELILPPQVSEYKVETHHQFIKEWIISKNIASDFDSVWRIREKCISSLSEKHF